MPTTTTTGDVRTQPTAYFDITNGPPECCGNPHLFVTTQHNIGEVPRLTFQIPPNIGCAVLSYRFLTDEIPGGFFGTEFNDFFEVSITSAPPSGDPRADEVSAADSILGLGLGAFSVDGATNTFTLSLDVTNKSGHFVTFGVGVGNAIDNLFDSAICADVSFQVGSCC